jgi:DNA primase
VSNKIDWDAIRRLPILEVAANLGIEIKGKNALCFGGHDKKTRSLHFDPKKNLWHCFGCGLGGSVVELVREARSFLTSRDAALWIQGSLLDGGHRLANTRRYAGAPARSGSASQVRLDSSHEAASAFRPESDIYEWIMKRCPLRDDGARYLQVARGFDRGTIDYFQIGELDDPNRLLMDLRATWPMERLIQCGVLVNRPESQSCRLVWWEKALLFPFFVGGHVVYIQARQIHSGKTRYINLRGVQVPMFNVRSLESLKVGTRIYVCEGIPDTMTAHQLGLIGVGCLGANAFREEWARILAPFEVIVVPDGDSGGEKFYSNVRGALGRLGHSVERIRIPPGEDFSSAYKKGLLGLRSSPRKVNDRD